MLPPLPQRSRDTPDLPTVQLQTQSPFAVMTTRPLHKFRSGDECEVQIQNLEYGGQGLGRLCSDGILHDKPVLVPRSAPGDRLRVRIGRVQSRYVEAEHLEVLRSGPNRIDPVCPHWNEGCGGCSWQHLSYAAQLQAKVTVIRDSLERLGGFKNLTIDPIVASNEPWFYRNKMEFTFNARDGLGLHVAGDWRRVIPVTDCRLESKLAMEIVAVARHFINEHRLSSWDPDTGHGLLHELVIRHGRGSGETMVGLVTSAEPFPEAQALASAITLIDESIVSVVHGTRMREQRGSPLESIRVLEGRKAIIEQIGELQFHIGLQTFFQTSTAQAERMLQMVKNQVQTEQSGKTAPELILDVFCGVGLFTLALSERAKKVIGIDIVEPSIIAARENARLNKIDNVVFYTGDARRALPDILEHHGKPDSVVLDPPRSGAGGKVIRRLARAEPQRIVYVSCNPTTLATDLKELEPFGYEVSRIQPIDLFPQTYHVETIAIVDRRGDAPPAAQVRPC